MLSLTLETPFFNFHLFDSFLLLPAQLILLNSKSYIMTQNKTKTNVEEYSRIVTLCRFGKRSPYVFAVVVRGDGRLNATDRNYCFDVVKSINGNATQIIWFEASSLWIPDIIMHHWG